MHRPDTFRPWETELELDTALGNHIANFRTTEATPPNVIERIAQRNRQQFPRIRPRPTRSTSTYNCHGLVFAARRTAIFDALQVRSILNDDRYEKLSGEGEALPGDIAIYVSQNGAINHSAVVIAGAPDSGLCKLPTVLSKWAHWIEVVHYVSDCPWAQEPDSTVEYYRLVHHE